MTQNFTAHGFSLASLHSTSCVNVVDEVINPSSSSLGVTGVYCVSLVPNSICIIVSLFDGPCSKERERELNLHNQAI